MNLALRDWAPVGSVMAGIEAGRNEYRWSQFRQMLAKLGLIGFSYQLNRE